MCIVIKLIIYSHRIKYITNNVNTRLHIMSQSPKIFLPPNITKPKNCKAHNDCIEYRSPRVNDLSRNLGVSCSIVSSYTYCDARHILLSGLITNRHMLPMFYLIMNTHPVLCNMIQLSVSDVIKV